MSTRRRHVGFHTGRPELRAAGGAPEAAHRSASCWSNDIIEELRPKLGDFPGMRVYLQNPPTIRIGGQVTKSLYQFSMQIAG